MTNDKRRIQITNDLKPGLGLASRTSMESGGGLAGKMSDFFQNMLGEVPPIQPSRHCGLIERHSPVTKGA